MANTNAVYARIDTTLKENAESILNQLGITPSSAIQMLYSQIVLQKGMPFELRLPANKKEKPLALGSITRDELDKELQKGLDSLRSGKSYSADEVDQFFAKEYGA
ncbi:type II toxin-antitoxin system RelB/DinJ family antitoxin [Amygdalobacter nucleatus]|uniref:type II toxin-antitoxin system RelB/DinJ family antitoxin n=1 Tax=Amygdalobacter nucleatus TaxID=3029274 RepID=UPI002799773F|nr:type II toxin-antitoxin system RelB/DinJ family antitoxin [Amygdalobacter nucleatus]WEG36980.1 type II toxin-antitoxin system RelB/DinJ family antitoxin [Amygdalobacter nucleatus]